LGSNPKFSILKRLKDLPLNFEISMFKLGFEF
jgi:hypothetical protein